MFQIIVQRAAKKVAVPPSKKLQRWARKALENRIAAAEVTIRIVNEEEMINLNSTYRHKHGSTNVLSFPFDMPSDIELDVPILGDIIICAEVIEREASAQNKPAEAHWAHMVVHGILHLLGYDHETDTEAVAMESQEIKILASLNFNNPYQMREKGKYHD